MRRLLILLAASILSYSCQHSDKKVTSDNVVRIGVVDSIFSKVLNEQRKIWVYIPKEDSFHAKKRYPVMYLLDGDGHFSSTVGIVQQLSSVNGNTVCPEMIIVGIPNTDRTRDLTPTKAGGYFDGDTTILSTSGGAENFTKFIETELIPYIDKSYATTDHRVIIGHSFGGLFVVNTLLNHSSVFSNYIAIDPSLWWDKNRLVKNSIGRLKGEKYKNKSLFVAVANTLNPGMRLDEAFSDTTQNTKHIRSILEFIEETKRNNDGALVINSKYYENDSHGSVPLIATYDRNKVFLFLV